MREGWKQVKLGQLFQVKHGWAFKGKFFGSEGKLIVVTPGNFYESGGFRLQEGKEKFYLNSFPNGYLLKKNDLIIAMTEQGTGLLGSPALIPEDNKFLHNQRIGLLTDFDESAVDKIFIYYLFFTHRIRATIYSTSTGIKVKHTAPERIHRIHTLLPPLPTQRKIASILSAYDDLIENNLKRIKLLEEKAQHTYEEWFNIEGTPEGWSEFRLGELIDYHIGGGWGVEIKNDKYSVPAFVIRGTDINNLKLGSKEKVPYRWHTVSNLNSRKLQHGDIVFEVSGGSSYEGVAKTLLITNNLINQFNGSVMCASFCKLMRPKSVDYSFPLILFFKYLRKSKATEIFEKRSASNIVNYNWEAFLKFQTVKMPKSSLLNKFNAKVKPLLILIYCLGEQNHLLKEARDILLPRLMTGMIDVDAIDLPEDLT